MQTNTSSHVHSGILHPFPGQTTTKQKGKKLSWKIRLAIYAAILFIVLALIAKTVMSVAAFFDKNTMVFRPPVTVALNQPVSIVKRTPKVETIVQIINQLQPMDGIKSPIEEYICKKWGAYDCKTAIAVARAESGMKEEAYHANDNGSIDVGIFQVNSTHFKQAGCSLKELVNGEKNADCAFNIWDAADGISGNGKGNFNAWTVYKTGAYTVKLNEM